MFKPSKNPKVEEITKSCKDRSYNLSCLLAIKLPELNEKGRPKRLCAWCAEIELYHGNQKYCSQECSDSAMAWAYPQKENALKFLLIRQEWKCAICQFDYKPFLDIMIQQESSKYNYYGYKSPADLPWHHFKRLKSIVPQAYRLEVDHIIPIYKGGTSLGLDNHWAICYSDHKKKTSKDLSGKRK